MLAEEIESIIASKSEGLALRPGPNDLSVKRVIIARVVDGFAETVPSRWSESERYPVADIVTACDADAVIGTPSNTRGPAGNYKEARALAELIEDVVGFEPDDGRGRRELRLTLGQLRRLADLVSGMRAVAPR